MNNSFTWKNNGECKEAQRYQGSNNKRKKKQISIGNSLL